MKMNDDDEALLNDEEQDLGKETYPQSQSENPGVFDENGRNTTASKQFMDGSAAESEAEHSSEEETKKRKPTQNDEEDDDEEDEEDDDDAKSNEEMSGFIVEDAAVEEEETGLRSDVDSDSDSSNDDIAGLDEDDLDLIAENMGLAAAHDKTGAPPRTKESGFHRLRRHRDFDSAEEEDFDEGPASGRQDQASIEEEDDEEDDTIGAPWSGDASGSRNMLPAEVAHLLAEVFGDVDCVLEILGRRRPRTTGDDPTTELLSMLHKPGGQRKGGEVAEVADETTLRLVNQPERLFERYLRRPRETSAEELQLEARWMVSKLKNSGDAGGISWDPLQLAQRYKEILGAQHKAYDPQKTTVEADVEAKISGVLHMLLDLRLEVTFIEAHRHHLIMPPLTPSMLWRIYDLDLEWWRLRSMALHLKKLLSNAPSLNEAMQKQLLHTTEHFTSEEELEDIRAFLVYAQPDLFQGDDPLGESVLTETPATPAMQTNSANRVRRRHAAPGLDAVRMVRRYNLEKTWQPFLLSPDGLAANIGKSDVFAALLSDPEGPGEVAALDVLLECPVPDEPPLPGRDESAVRAWLGAQAVGPFNSGERVLEALIQFEAKHLAAHPYIRASLRTWFRKVARLTTVTTPAGQQALPPGKPYWAITRILRKKISSFLDAPIPPEPARPTHEDAHEEWRCQIEETTRRGRLREIFAAILKAESDNFLQMVFHPLSRTDSVLGQTGDPEEICRARYADAQIAAELGPADLKQYQASDQADKNTINRLLSVLKQLYIQGTSSVGWGPVVQERILARLIEKELLPCFRREVRHLLARTAHNHVADRCRAVLDWALSCRPYEKPTGKPFFDLSDNDLSDSESDEESDDSGASEDWKEVLNADYTDRPAFYVPRTVALVLEKNDGIQIPRVHACAVDRRGMPTRFHTFDALLVNAQSVQMMPRRSNAESAVMLEKKAAAELKTLRRFLMHTDVSPDVVVIGASDLACRQLREVIEKLRGRVPGRRRFAVYMESLEVPRVFAASPLCAREFIDNHGVPGAQALGLARYVQNPLASILQLWSVPPDDQNLLLSLKLHPLQRCVPRERLEAYLLQSIMSAVAQTGLDLLAIKDVPHWQAPLQFVAGLGKVKAQDLLNKLGVGAHLINRSELQTLGDCTYDPQAGLFAVCEGPIGPAVYLNCASFIKLGRLRDLKIAANDVDCAAMPDPLSMCRIDPVEWYTTAMKMSRDALEDEGVHLSATECVAAVLRHPRILDDLDLEAYSQILAKKGQVRMLPILEGVRKELEMPFRDNRLPFEGATGARLFYLLVQEDSHEFRSGVEATVHIAEARGNYLRLTLPPSQIPAAALDFHELLAEERSKLGKEVSAEDLFRRGGMALCRIRSLDYNKYTANVVLTQRAATELLLQQLDSDTPGLMDRTAAKAYVLAVVASHSISSIPDDAASAAEYQNLGDIGVQNQPFGFQKIRHPLFRNHSHQTLIRELRQAPLGRALFRSVSPTELHMYVQVSRVGSSNFSCKIISIRDVSETHPGTTQRYRIGNETFCNIDQIMDDYISPLIINLQEIYTFEKFYSGSLEEAEAELLQRQREAPNQKSSIEWAIVLDTTYHPQKLGIRFHLVTLPPQTHRPLRDGIYCFHDSVRLWTRSEKSVRRLVTWWKKDGFFRRTQLLAEYNREKRRAQQLKQQEQQMRVQEEHIKQEAMNRGGYNGFRGPAPVVAGYGGRG